MSKRGGGEGVSPTPLEGCGTPGALATGPTNEEEEEEETTRFDEACSARNSMTKCGRCLGNIRVFEGLSLLEFYFVLTVN